VVPIKFSTGETFVTASVLATAEYGFEGGPVWFAPEESGSDGLGFAVTPDGTAQALEAGSLLKENVVAASSIGLRMLIQQCC